MAGQSGCNSNKGLNYDCEDIASWDCYRNGVRNDCCVTCEGYKYSVNLTSSLQGCDYGDRVPGCMNIVGPNGRHCYNNTIRYDCCEECFYRETGLPDCRFGDRAGMCNYSQCDTYNPQKLYDCCDTCYVDNLPASTSFPPSTSSTLDYSPTSLYSSSSTNPTSTSRLRDDDDLSDWVIPGIISMGIVIIIAVAVIIYLIYRRRQSKPPLITDQMYKDYKISKRTPVPPPRPDVDNNFKLQRRDSAEYAYINPDELRADEANGGSAKWERSNNVPLPERPKEDTYLSNPDKYGYFQAEGRKINTDPYTSLENGNAQPGPYTSLSQRSDEDARRQNSYVIGVPLTK